ncbi:MAG: LamG-like jellyroll fold domain-containing protein [Armatimonadota bacterium]
MRRMTVGIAILALVVGSVVAATAAEIAEEDVLLKVELENWGETSGLQPVAHEEAAGGVAMSMASDALAIGGLDLEAGEYTLLFFDHAPAGDQDAFFVEIEGERARMKGHIGSWGTIVHPFTVEEAGPITIAVIGQEAGMTVDQMAIVRGHFEPGEIAFADVPGETTGESVGLDEIERLNTACKLAEAPSEPMPATEETVHHEDFEARCAGVSGEHRWIDGPFGQALVLDMPDGRFTIDASALDIGEQGTVEWWVKPREAARIWWDQGWHFFLHAEPAEEGGVQIDLDKYRHSLSLTVTNDGEPYARTEGTHERVQMGTGGYTIEDWHHMLVSWDFTGDRQYLWMMTDGEGMQGFFPRTFEPGGFSRIELGNTPSDWDVPYLPMDGAIDAIRISNVSVEARLAD